MSMAHAAPSRTSPADLAIATAQQRETKKSRNDALLVLCWFVHPRDAILDTAQYPPHRNLKRDPSKKKKKSLERSMDCRAAAAMFFHS